jgi:uncharacterized protein
MFKINVDSIPPIPWKNGGGVTRDLRVTDAYRISLADIDQDGAFSSFENATRHFAVVEGEGVFLEFGYDSHRLTKHTPPFTFAGDNPPYCRLLNGKTRDINLMVFKGVGEMSRSYNPRFKETGFLSQDLVFTWFGEEKPQNITIKGLWFGYNS